MTEIELGPELLGLMETYAKAVAAMLGSESIAGYIVRIREEKRYARSVVYWLRTTWMGCEHYVKIYRKWGRGDVLRPVVGLSHVVACGGKLIYYPAVDSDDGKSPCEDEAIVLWRYEGKKGESVHLVLPPVKSREEAVEVMKNCNDDPKHAAMAEFAKYGEFDFAVLRVSSYLDWRERVLESRFADEPMALLHKTLRSQLWLWSS